MEGKRSQAHSLQLPAYQWDLVLLRHCAMLAGNCSSGCLWAGKIMRSVGGEWVGRADTHFWLPETVCAKKKKKNFWKLTRGLPLRNVKYTPWKTGQDLSICSLNLPIPLLVGLHSLLYSKPTSTVSWIQYGDAKSKWGNTPRLGSKRAVGEIWQGTFTKLEIEFKIYSVQLLASLGFY